MNLDLLDDCVAPGLAISATPLARIRNSCFEQLENQVISTTYPVNYEIVERLVTLGRYNGLRPTLGSFGMPDEFNQHFRSRMW